MSFATATQTAYAPKTQKAKSVYALKSAGFSTPAFSVQSAQFYRDNPHTLQNLTGRFVRPCPMHPRHGFVDSRPIVTLEDAEKIIAETLAADADGEIIAMPYVDAEYSAIFTDGMLAVGPGTDGATLGNKSKIIPVIGYPANDFYRWDSAKQSAGITESPFVEILFKSRYGKDYQEMDTHVSSNWEAMFVQLRNGPKLPCALDYVPSEMKVQRIVYAKADGTHLLDESGKEIDLLEWESIAIELGKEKNTVVYHPGGNLASHCAVHCVLNHVPIVCTFKPEIGQTLEKTADRADADLKQMRSGFVLGCQAKINYVQAAFAMLAAAHLTSVWVGKADFLLGFGMGCAYRLTVSAGLGEYRHRAHVVLHKDCSGPGKMKNRDTVYRGCWNKILTPSTRQRFIKALHSFRTEHWGGSFGGQKWYQFCAFAAETYNSLLSGDSVKALTAFNQTVHAAHNGGWAFDKFISEKDMNLAANNPCAIVLRCAPDLYTALTIADENSGLDKWFKYRCEIKTHVDLDQEIKPNKFSCDECGYTSKKSYFDSCPNCGYTKDESEDESESEYAFNDSDETESASTQTKYNVADITKIQVKKSDNGKALHFQFTTGMQMYVGGKQYFAVDVAFNSNDVTYIEKAIESNPNKVISMANKDAAEIPTPDKLTYVTCELFGNLVNIGPVGYPWYVDINGKQV